jgi:hypothetical protein
MLVLSVQEHERRDEMIHCAIDLPIAPFTRRHRAFRHFFIDSLYEFFVYLGMEGHLPIFHPCRHPKKK